MSQINQQNLMAELMMSSKALPPLGNLPSWARLSQLDNKRFRPKLFLSERLSKLPPTKLPTEEVNNHCNINTLNLDELSLDDDDDLEGLSAHAQVKIKQYKKTVKFLQKIHADTLKKLHAEIEILKEENKDLQFQSIIKRKLQNVVKPNDNLENNEKMKELRQMIKNAQARNNMLHFALRKIGVSVDSTQPMLQIEKSTSQADINNHATLSHKLDEMHDPEREDSTELLNPQQSLVLPLGATLNPLMVSVQEGVKPRTPTVEECDVIIKHLYKANIKQMEENIELRSDLRKLLFAKEIREKKIANKSQERLTPDTLIHTPNPVSPLSVVGNENKKQTSSKNLVAKNLHLKQTAPKNPQLQMSSKDLQLQ